MNSFTLSKPSWKTYKRASLYLTGMAVTVLVQMWAINNRYNRMFWVGTLFVIIIAMVYLVFEKKKRIRSKSDDKERAWEVARLKLEAERTSGFALIFAIGLFYQYGFDFDKGLIDNRFAHWRTVNNQIHRVMTETFCSVVPSRRPECQNVKNDVNNLVASFYSDSGEPTRKIAHRLIDTLQNKLEVPPNSDQASEFEPALGALRALDVSDDLLNLIAKSLPILSVVLGSFAISSKIAVAKVDFDERDGQRRAAETRRIIEEKAKSNR